MINCAELVKLCMLIFYSYKTMLLLFLITFINGKFASRILNSEQGCIRNPSGLHIHTLYPHAVT